MIAEAIDTAYSIGWAITAWIIVIAAVATIGLIAAAVTGACVWKAARQAYRKAWRGRQTPHTPAHDSHVTEIPANPSNARTAPSWARTDQEAA